GHSHRVGAVVQLQAILVELLQVDRQSLGAGAVSHPQVRGLSGTQGRRLAALRGEGGDVLERGVTDVGPRGLRILQIQRGIRADLGHEVVDCTGLENGAISQGHGETPVGKGKAPLLGGALDGCGGAQLGKFLTMNSYLDSHRNQPADRSANWTGPEEVAQSETFVGALVQWIRFRHILCPSISYTFCVRQALNRTDRMAPCRRPPTDSPFGP